MLSNQPNHVNQSLNNQIQTDVRDIVVISDTHCGCRLGLCPPGGVSLDDGGTYHTSKLQDKLWAIYKEFCDSWLPSVLQNRPFDLVHNGDVIDGVHHDSTTQISHNLYDQNNIAVLSLKDLVQRARKYYHIRGTEAHVGKSGVEEERVARDLGAVPNSEGQFARYDLWLKRHDKIFHFLHHVGTVSSNAYEASAVGKELNEEINEAGRWGRPIPDCIVRSHRHRYIEVALPTYKGKTYAFVTPAWQLKTPFTFKVAGARLAPPQIGGCLIHINEDGSLTIKDFVKPIIEPNYA